MQNSLLISGSLLGLLLGVSQPGRAQYILAGQTTGATYVDLVPDKTLHIQRTSGVVQFMASDSLDLDADGRFDLRFYVRGSTPTGPGTFSALWSTANVLHSNVNAIVHEETSQIKNLNYKDTIQVKTFNTPTPHPFTWASDRADYYVCSATSFASTINYGQWRDDQDGYLAFRIRSTSLGQWRYGWVRMQVLPNHQYIIPDTHLELIIKDYAFTTAALSERAAMAAGWQIYPTLVADQVRVQPPPATTGNLAITDACGRPLLHAPLATAGQQLNLSALAAGVYLLHVQTTTGSFVQRLVKQ